nr:MAG TPA: hypothetical protein [Caudoviricetes sp.]
MTTGAYGTPSIVTCIISPLSGHLRGAILGP